MLSISQLTAHADLHGWKPGLILFLAMLLPLTPLLAQVEETSRAHRPPMAAADHPFEGGLAAYFAAQVSPASFSLTVELSKGPYSVLLPLEGAPPSADACSAGKKDADEKTGGALWFSLGLVTGPWGVLGAYLIDPSTSDINLKGKSKTFVSAYTNCYVEEAKGIHVKWAWIGFGTAVSILLIVFTALLLNNKPS